MIELQNISGGQIVCDLKTEGKTLRLDNKDITTIDDFEVTEHIENLVNKGLLISRSVKVKNTKNSALRKEENNG
jgi:hypothetical protein|nr:MAG TPA: hypothetical protein [Caudoviricetes sp.]